MVGALYKIQFYTPYLNELGPAMPFNPQLELASVTEQLTSAKAAHDEIIARASSIPPREEMTCFSASMSQEELRASFKKFLGRDELPESLEASIRNWQSRP